MHKCPTFMALMIMMDFLELTQDRSQTLSECIKNTTHDSVKSLLTYLNFDF